MEKGKFYAIGVGPGDPELLTVKAIKAIEGCDYIAVPKSGADINIALKIARDYVKGKDILEYDMPMTKDEAVLKACHLNSAEDIKKLIEDGKSVGFLTLGDPVVYSTVMYVHRILTDWGYDTRVINGITSFCAAAASLNVSLCEKDEMLHIIPATFTDLDSIDDLDGTKVLMKSGKTIMKVKEKLTGHPAMLVERATMEEEKIYKSLEDLEEPTGYFSIILVHSKERVEGK